MDEAEVMFFASRHNNKKLPQLQLTLKVDRMEVMSSTRVKNLEVYYDTTLCMEGHVNSDCKQAYMQLRNVGHIRRYLSKRARDSFGVFEHAQSNTLVKSLCRQIA